MARILIVDDDKLVLQVAKDILEEQKNVRYRSPWKMHVTTAADAGTALLLIKENNYELIITDILMAKMDGWELIKEIRKRFPSLTTPIAVMSAVNGIDIEYETVRHGASAWISKPLNSKEFISKVIDLIQER